MTFFQNEKSRGVLRYISGQIEVLSTGNKMSCKNTMQNIIKNNCKIKFIVIIYKKYKQ